MSQGALSVPALVCWLRPSPPPSTSSHPPRSSLEIQRLGLPWGLWGSPLHHHRPPNTPVRTSLTIPHVKAFIPNQTCHQRIDHRPRRIFSRW